MTTNYTQSRICVERPLNHEKHIIGSIHDRGNSPYHIQHLQAAFLKQKIWPSHSNITIGFMSTSKNNNPTWTPISVLESKKDANGKPIPLDPLEHHIRNLSPIEAVKKVVTERIIPLVNLHITFVPAGTESIVRVTFDPDGGAWSLVGTDHSKEDKNNATLNLGWLDVGTICHEFCHMLGMVHEHQNSRGEHIKWNDKAVYEWAQQTQGWDHTTTYNNILRRYNVNQLNGSQFDPLSIMLYFFPADLTTDHKGTHMNAILSPYDVTYIMKMYPDGPMTPKEFYKFAYGKDIGQVQSNEDNRSNINSSFWFYFILVAIALIFVSLIIWVYKTR